MIIPTGPMPRDKYRTHVLVTPLDMTISEPGGPKTPGAIRAMGPGLLAMACPGCGTVEMMAVGHPKPEVSPSWDMAMGTPDAPDTITLRPSIDCKSCCGWHGYLTNGVYVSCFTPPPEESK